ncbi:MAG TPA: hypothetical protein VGK35_12080 [Actinotalea sp.]|jgi:hypothetical protein
MFVLTIDQEGSRRLGDRVEGLLSDLEPHTRPGRGVIRRFERTVGDEVQAVLSDPEHVVDLTLTVLRWGGWSVGVGCGPVAEPLPVSARAGTGQAFVLARAAVEAAKSRARLVPLAVRGERPWPAQEAEAVLTLLAAVAARRTPAGWDVVDAMAAGGPLVRQDEVAHTLGITQQAVSQRLRTALWAEERAARPAAARLLGLAASADEDDRVRPGRADTEQGEEQP